MTYPGQGDQFGQQWQPQQPQPQWQQPQQEWARTGPQHAQQWPPTGPQPTQQWQHTAPYGQMPPGPLGKSKKGLIIGLVVALVALVGGGVTWLALSLTGGSSGSASPGEAADVMLTAVQEGDLVGVMDSLAPGEAAVLSDLVSDYVDELKRIEVLDSSADASNVSGLDLEATEELKFDDSKALKINDHLTMAALTDGTLQFRGTFSEIPFAQSFKDAVFPPEVQAELESENPNETIDIGEQVRATGQPIYIATVEVDGEWYPSLFHTIAHYILVDEGEQWPTSSTPAVGADSPKGAIEALVEAIRTTDAQKVIEILPPDEMAVLHDLGPLLIEQANADSDSQNDLPFQITKLETEESEVSGGTRSTITGIEASFTEDGETHAVSYSQDGDCYDMTFDGESQRMCAADIGKQLSAELGPDAPPQLVESLTEITQAIYEENFGIVTVEVDGKHYVSPLRTFSDLGLTFLKAVEPEHVKQLLEFIPR